MGRDEWLNVLGRRLRSRGSVVVSQAIGGMGGVGKTSLAAALVDEHRGEFDLVWWVRAETPDLLVADLAELAAHLDVPGAEDQEAAAGLVRRFLEATDRSWLVVFDNAPDQRAIEQWLPQRGNGAVVITSRATGFSLVDEVVHLDTLGPDAAEGFLRDRVRRDNPKAADEDLTEVVDRLGGLPLALEQAGAWVSQVPNRTFAQFVGLYDDAARDPFGDGDRPTGYDHTATTTWRVSIDAAVTRAPLAERLMAVLGYLAPEPVPCKWLRTLGDDPYLDQAGQQPIDAALSALHAYSLAGITDDDTITVHRVVQTAARRDPPPDALVAAVRVLRAQAPDNAADHANWPTLAALAPHGLALTEHATPTPPEAAQDLWWILDDIAIYQRDSGNVAAAITTATTVLHVTTAHNGPDHAQTLSSRNNLAHAYQAAGDLNRAIPLFEANLADIKRVQGPDHPDTLSSRNNLAHAYQAAGDLNRAIPLFEANLADIKRVLGPNHPNTLISRNNLAGTYESAGNLDRAIPLYEATVADSQQVLGPDHPDTLTSRNNLAYAYREAGDLARAIPVFEANLADRERVLGPDHPDTLASRNNLAGTYQTAGDLDRAIPLHESTLADRERVLGPDHPDTLISRNDLAYAYQAAGDLDRAIPLYETNLADRERVLGPDHPHTLASRNNLAGTYQTAGDLDRAIPLFEANLADRERVLGPNHPNTLTSRNNLAYAYQAAGDLARAIPLFEANLADIERILGPNHPNTLTSRNNLTGARQAQREPPPNNT